VWLLAGVGPVLGSSISALSILPILPPAQLAGYSPALGVTWQKEAGAGKVSPLPQSRQFAISSCRELPSLVPLQHLSHQAREESEQEQHDDHRQCRAAQQKLRNEWEAPIRLEVHRVRLVE